MTRAARERLPTQQASHVAGLLPHRGNMAERVEKVKASIRAKVEHPFRVIKQQLGFTRMRYRGLAKSTAQIVTLFALSNLWMARRRLIGIEG